MSRDRKKGRPPPPHDSTAGDSAPDREALREAFAGVKPLRGAKKRVTRTPDDRPTRPNPRGRRPSRPTRLSVARDIDDTVIAQRPSTHASILDTLESPHVEIQAECDLHGMTTEEADRAVLRFLRQSHEAGKRWLLVIVGKGLHSPGGKSTLRDHVIHTLSHGTAARYVLAFRTAPRRHGGTGALTVRLADRV